MKIYKFLLIPFMVVLAGCRPISTEEITVDRSIVQKQIAELENELSEYEGGLLKALIKLRIETLKHTDDMLAQKMTGINRFITIKYTIGGKTYQRPSDYQKEVKAVEDDMRVLDKKIVDLQSESDQYAGGLIKIMLQMQIEIEKLTLAMMAQKRLGVLHEFPVYYNPELSAELEREKARATMKGSIESNL